MGYSAFKDNDIEFVGLSRIEPNPKIESVREGVKLFRENNLKAIVEIGCAKAISAAVGYNGDAWDLLLDSSLITKAILIFTVLTLSAAGTKMNGNAVFKYADK